MRRPHSSLFILHSDNPLPGRPVLCSVRARAGWAERVFGYKLNELKKKNKRKKQRSKSK